MGTSPAPASGQTGSMAAEAFGFDKAPVEAQLPRVIDMRHWSVQAGDKLVVTVSPHVGVGPGGAAEIADWLRKQLDLPDDVKIAVLAPGITVEVVTGR